MKKINLNKEVIYSVLIVVVLFILFIGDDIALKLIPENPNPNNTSFGGGELVPVNYINQNIKEINSSDVISLINNKKSFILIFVRKDCYACELLIDKKNVLDESVYPVYFLDVDKNYQDSKFDYLMKIDLRIYEKKDLSPLAVKFQDGIVMDTMVGIGKNKRLYEFFNQI